MALKQLILIALVVGTVQAMAAGADAAFNAYLKDNAKDPVLSKKVKIQQAFVPHSGYAVTSEEAKGKNADKPKPQDGQPADPSVGGPMGDSGLSLSSSGSSSGSSSSSSSGGSTSGTSSSPSPGSTSASGSFGASSSLPSAPVAPVSFNGPATGPEGTAQAGFAASSSTGTGRTPSSGSAGGVQAGFDPGEVPPGVDPEAYRSAYQAVDPNQVVGSALGNWYRERDERRRRERERQRLEWERRRRENGLGYGSDR